MCVKRNAPSSSSDGPALATAPAAQPTVADGTTYTNVTPAAAFATVEFADLFFRWGARFRGGGKRGAGGGVDSQGG